MREYFKAERYLDSLLNLAIVKKVPIPKKARNIGGKKEEDYLLEEGVLPEYIKKGVGLNRMKALMEILGHPEEGHKILHIAGTSGKGSVAIITHEILKRTNLKTGLYTSPHLTLAMERIKLGDYLISPEDFVNYLNIVKEANNSMYDNHNFGSPSYHETVFSTALLYFKNEKPDITVVETGLGWKKDYTKIIPSSIASIITNISYDHTDYLGNSLESITENKSDIISDNSLCITGCKEEKLLKIIEKKAQNKKARVIAINRDFQVYPKELQNNSSLFDYKSKYNEYKNLKINLAGKHQSTNGAIAISAAEEILNLYGMPLDEVLLREALESVKLPGRLEVISKNPGIIIDGAHNPAKMEVLSNAVRNQFSFDRLIVILGAIEGKDIKIMLKKIVPLSDLVIATLPRVSGRISVSPRQVAYKVREMGGKAVIKLDPFEALTYGLSKVREKDLLCITGSLYMSGELRTEWVSKKYIMEKRNNILP